jgi:DNA mismatch repair protein MutS
MAEMQEVSNILNNATKNSLILLDEIGRGTSTHDGLAIAWAVSEYILNNIKAKTLFATHYIELSKLASSHENAFNLSVKVEESESGVRFLYKVIPGKRRQELWDICRQACGNTRIRYRKSKGIARKI